MADVTGTFPVRLERLGCSGAGHVRHVPDHPLPPGSGRAKTSTLQLLSHGRFILGLGSGELVTWEGDYFRVDSARVWDAPEGGVPIAIAVSGENSVAQFAPLDDHLVAVEPDDELIKGPGEGRG